MGGGRKHASSRPITCTSCPAKPNRSGTPIPGPHMVSRVRVTRTGPVAYRCPSPYPTTGAGRESSHGWPGAGGDEVAVDPHPLWHWQPEDHANPNPMLMRWPLLLQHISLLILSDPPALLSLLPSSLFTITRNTNINYHMLLHRTVFTCAWRRRALRLNPAGQSMAMLFSRPVSAGLV